METRSDTSRADLHSEFPLDLTVHPFDNTYKPSFFITFSKRLRSALQITGPVCLFSCSSTSQWSTAASPATADEYFIFQFTLVALFLSLLLGLLLSTATFPFAVCPLVFTEPNPTKNKYSTDTRTRRSIWEKLHLINFHVLFRQYR